MKQKITAASILAQLFTHAEADTRSGRNASAHNRKVFAENEEQARALACYLRLTWPKQAAVIAKWLAESE